MEVDEDVSAGALEVLLHVAYTDCLPDMSGVVPTGDMAKELLFAAKHMFERLRLMCEEWMCTFVNMDTVADILPLADTCRLLKAACDEFVTLDHVWPRVTGTDGFGPSQGNLS